MADQEQEAMLPYGVDIIASSVKGLWYRPMPADVLLEIQQLEIQGDDGDADGGEEEGAASAMTSDQMDFARVMLYHGLCAEDGSDLPGITCPEDVGRLAHNVFFKVLPEYQGHFVATPKPTPDTP